MKKGVGSIVFSDEKRGQVTIFIIIAIVVVGIVALAYFFIPRTSIGTTFDPTNPAGFMQNCLEDDIESVVSLVSSQGGSLNPEFYFTYNDVNIEYLCYTSEPVPALCVVQQPLLKQHIESQVRDDIVDEVDLCFSNLQENYREQGYTVNLDAGRTSVELLPKRIVTRFDDYILTVTKDETSRYDSLSVVLNNNLYELISIAKSIVEWEATIGEADPRIYMTYYPDLRVNKNTRDEGTRIYTLADRNRGNEFVFATRSFVFRPGH